MEFWKVLTWHPEAGLARPNKLRDVYIQRGGLLSGLSSTKGLSICEVFEDENTYIGRYMAESAPKQFDKPTNRLLIVRRVSHTCENGHLKERYLGECPDLTQFIQDEDHHEKLDK